ncbi:MAG: Glu/Leu/Phe/Val dehydrogenase [Deltaproteobacteria bacterium]|nr:Glu/Leu/Phe/Val dehydrogenase [Deltaproteobacteria bacterium]
MLIRSTLVALLVAVSPSIVLAEPLPGILNPAVIEAGRTKAAQQKRDAQTMVRTNAQALGYSNAQINQALQPTMVRKGTFRIALKDGTQVEFPWYRTGFAENRIANVAKKPGAAQRHETNKGGVRLHHGVFADEVYALAVKMDTKLAIARDAINGYSMRGAKGGIGAGRVVKVGTHYQAKVGDFVDPASKIFDRGAIIRKFGEGYRASGGAVGPGLDIQAGDVNTKAPEMKVLAATYGSAKKLSFGVSGKAVKYTKDGKIDPTGGIEYRGISTGEGTWMSARLAAHRVGLKLRGATVACQGWGEVGQAFGMAALKDGARIVAIQNRWILDGKKVVGTLLSPYGAKARPAQVKAWIAEVNAFRQSGENIRSFKGGKLFPYLHTDLDISQVKADIVGNNALGNVLSEKTVPQTIKAGTHAGRRRIHVEGANLAETAGGAKLIDQNRDKLLVVPGDLANLGGVHVSNLEAVQNLYGEAVTSRKAKLSLLGTIRAAWNKVLKVSKAQGITERRAVERVAVDGMMRRSLHLAGAPRTNLEGRVISKQRRQVVGKNLLASLGGALKATTPRARTPRTTAKRVRRSRRTTLRPGRRSKLRTQTNRLSTRRRPGARPSSLQRLGRSMRRSHR